MADRIDIQAIGRRRKIGRDDLAKVPSGASAASRVAPPPKGANTDALAIKVRQQAEDIPEGKVDRPAGRGKKRMFGLF